MPAVFVAVWSTGFIVARYGMPHAPPMTFLAMRYALSIACFLPWIVLARVPWPKGRLAFAHLTVTGLLMQGGYLGGVWAAVKGGMGAGLIALVVGLQPLLTATWISARGGYVTRLQWVGLALGLGGLVLVVSHKLETGHEASLGSLALGILALASITCGTLYQKRHVAPCDVRTASTVQLAAALLATLPLALLEVETVRWNAELVGALAWSVLVLTLGGSSLLYLLIQRGAATAVTSLMYLVPPCTALMAWLLFGESITTATVVGTAMTAAGVALLVRRR
ncbi:DMT family transporter [Simplicispira hankyongi]|uniref:DMT family transporter n=2 Tax=Simplicispira hankyongi TaxID=2315688 RepID=A0A398CBT5_9BURK|nr:DMT family transporter [Simplicispira hankyongi]